MAIILSPFAKNGQTTINADDAGDLVVNQFYVDLKAADLVAGNVIDLGILPAGHTIDSAVLMPDKLDTNGTPTMTCDVGFMSGVPGQNDPTRTVGQDLFAGATASQTGVPVALPLTYAARSIMPVPYDRSIGVKIVTAPATAATSGRYRLRVIMFATDSNVQY